MEKLTAGQIKEANERLAALAKEGFEINNAIGPRLQERPELIVCIATQEDRGDAKALHHAKDSERRSLEEIARIERNYDNRQPLRSRYLPSFSDTDAYLIDRRRDIQSGLRRR